ncbi:MAG: FecR family protein [Verrucomicrobiota bacterium]
MNLVSKILIHSITVALVFTAGNARSADSTKKEARVTQVIREVKLLPSESSARPAVINEKVSEDTAVRTGDASRSELTFVDLTLTRLGENTIFSFNHAGRNARLDSGSILLRVPKNSGGGAIRTRAVTVGITGTTVIFESTRAGRSKLIVLEGGARLSLVKYPKQSAYVRAGQMLTVPAGATTIPEPVNIDLNRVMKTSPLITDFPPLPSQDLIGAAIEDQRNSSSGGQPVYQGVAVDEPTVGYPGLPPFYPGGSVGGGGRPKPPRGGGKPPAGGDTTTGGQPGGPGGGSAPPSSDGQPTPAGPKGPRGGVKPPKSDVGPVVAQPNGPSPTVPPVILRRAGQPKGSVSKGTVGVAPSNPNVSRIGPSPSPKKKIPKRSQPQIR